MGEPVHFGWGGPPWRQGPASFFSVQHCSLLTSQNKHPTPPAKLVTSERRKVQASNSHAIVDVQLQVGAREFLLGSRIHASPGQGRAQVCMSLSSMSSSKESKKLESAQEAGSRRARSTTLAGVDSPTSATPSISPGRRYADRDAEATRCCRHASVVAHKSFDSPPFLSARLEHPDETHPARTEKLPLHCPPCSFAWCRNHSILTERGA